MAFPSLDRDLNHLLIATSEWKNDTGKYIQFNKDSTFEYVQEWNL